MVGRHSSHLLLWLANAHEPLSRHCHRSVHRVSETDLGHGENEGDEVREDIYAIIVGDTGSREDEAGEENTEGV